jgi:CHAT domain-containing protein
MTTPPEVARAHAAGRILFLMRAAAGRELVDHRAARDEVDRLAAGFPDDEQITALASSARAGLGFAGGAGPADPKALLTAMEELGQLAGDRPGTADMLSLMRGLTEALEFHRNGDSRAAFDRFSELKDLADELPDHPMVRSAMAESSTMADLLRSLMDGAPDAGGVTFNSRLDAVRSLADRPDATDAERALYLNLGGGARLRMGEEQDLEQIEAGIADLRRATNLTAPGHPEHAFHLCSLALALYRRSEVSGSLDDLDEAIEHLERAREAARGPAHPHWTFVNDMLAEVHRRRGDSRPSRSTGLDSMRAYTWRVLLQPDPASARQVARTAATEAMALATRCLADHEPADALRALDAGRGLMLYAATELRDPYTRLVDAGQPELAERWRAEETPPPRLREEVLEVLSRENGLLDTPGFGEIQDALRTLDADALVYLVPADPPTTGWAVIAPAEGPPRFLPLPNLIVGEGSDLERYLTTTATRASRAARDIEPVKDAADTAFAESLDPLCDWAWKAAMGPIVQPFLASATGRRVPRLVLIPMGDLARVPWQAARDPSGVRLVEQVATSQAVSARMLCAAAAAPTVPPSSAGLILADPDTGDPRSDLRSARLEAYAIHRTFHPSATYVGRRPNGTVSSSGAGTAEDVRAWLRADGAVAGTMLHLASHGVIETALASASSRLVLAGGDLTADELMDVMSRDAGHRVGLVVLAACHTGESIHGYDEAYSLGTVFLAGGARSALSTQWSIPDRETSLLMYMFHHFRTAEHRPPWDALRRAQVWMLDAARTPPPTMPAPLRRMLDATDPARVVAWAGFVHWGQ